MDAFGKDVVIVETVGVGQSEIEIAELADTTLVAMQPGSGDSVQLLKAGILEVADVFVVNKADHPMALQLQREIRGMMEMLDFRGGWVPELVATRARGERRHRRTLGGDRVARCVSTHERGPSRPSAAARSRIACARSCSAISLDVSRRESKRSWMRVRRATDPYRAAETIVAPLSVALPVADGERRTPALARPSVKGL